MRKSDGSAVVALHDADFDQTLFVWSGRKARLARLAASDGQLSGGRTHYLPCAVVQAAVFCVEATPKIAPRLVRFGEGGSKTVISSPNPDPDSEGLLAETIAWQVSGSRASGVLIRPKIPGRLPLFVTYYRCAGYLRGGVGDEWPLRALAANGIAALCINSVPSGAVGEARYEQGMEAVRAAIDLLSKRGIVDPARVGMGGLSFGSEVTTWTLRHSDLLKAASIASVQLEPSYYWFNARPGRETFIENVREVWKVGSPDESPDGWKRLSAALDASNIHAPLLMQLPEHEARLSLELFSKLATARLAEMHIFPYAAHIKAELCDTALTTVSVPEMFRYWLQGGRITIGFLGRRSISAGRCSSRRRKTFRPRGPNARHPRSRASGNSRNCRRHRQLRYRPICSIDREARARRDGPPATARRGRAAAEGRRRCRAIPVAPCPAATPPMPAGGSRRPPERPPGRGRP